jgi:hypothetical protein
MEPHQSPLLFDEQFVLFLISTVLVLQPQYMHDARSNRHGRKCMKTVLLYEGLMLLFSCPAVDVVLAGCIQGVLQVLRCNRIEYP